jgi:hypothetical protein
MSEWGDASFFKDIAWPTNALELSFDYMFREPRGSESLTVYLDGQAIYYDGAQTTLATEHLTSSGALYVGTAGGMTRRLNFVLRTDGTLGGGVALDNIRVFGLVLGDVDLDGDVDLFDSGELQRCFGLQPVDNDCLAFDLDQTGDVGLSDFAIMEPNLTGPTTPGIP